jgi:hypothetical protein
LSALGDCKGRQITAALPSLHVFNVLRLWARAAVPRLISRPFQIAAHFPTSRIRLGQAHIRDSGSLIEAILHEPLLVIESLLLLRRNGLELIKIHVNLAPFWRATGGSQSGDEHA